MGTCTVWVCADPCAINVWVYICGYLCKYIYCFFILTLTANVVIQQADFSKPGKVRSWPWDDTNQQFIFVLGDISKPSKAPRIGGSCSEIWKEFSQFLTLLLICWWDHSPGLFSGIVWRGDQLWVQTQPLQAANTTMINGTYHIKKTNHQSAGWEKRCHLKKQKSG